MLASEQSRPMEVAHSDAMALALHAAQKDEEAVPAQMFLQRAPGRACSSWPASWPASFHPSLHLHLLTSLLWHPSYAG